MRFSFPLNLTRIVSIQQAEDPKPRDALEQLGESLDKAGLPDSELCANVVVEVKASQLVATCSAQTSVLADGDLNSLEKALSESKDSEKKRF